MDEMHLVWTEYMRYRAALRGYDLARIEDVVRYSTERYIDNVTGRLVAVGSHGRHLIMVPYEVDQGVMHPVTVHATTRGQVEARVRSGRFSYE